MFYLQVINNWIDLFMAIVLVFWSFAQIMLFCELGERLTDRFEKINDEILQCDWYTLPIQVQKILPMILGSTQQPFVINVFGSIRCSRETFKVVS